MALAVAEALAQDGPKRLNGEVYAEMERMTDEIDREIGALRAG